VEKVKDEEENSIEHLEEEFNVEKINDISEIRTQAIEWINLLKLKGGSFYSAFVLSLMEDQRAKGKQLEDVLSQSLINKCNFIKPFKRCWSKNPPIKKNYKISSG